MLEQLLPNVFWPEIWQANLDTLNMLLGSMLFTVLLGLPLGVLLFLTGPRRLFEQSVLYGALSLMMNILRSVPFVILLILMIPFTELLVDTSLDVADAIPPLMIKTTPFFGQLVETTLREVEHDIIKTTQTMNTNNYHIVTGKQIGRAHV